MWRILISSRPGNRCSIKMNNYSQRLRAHTSRRDPPRYRGNITRSDYAAHSKCDFAADQSIVTPITDVLNVDRHGHTNKVRPSENAFSIKSPTTNAAPLFTRTRNHPPDSGNRSPYGLRDTWPSGGITRLCVADTKRLLRRVKYIRAALRALNFVFCTGQAGQKRINV